MCITLILIAFVVGIILGVSWAIIAQENMKGL